MTKQSVSDEAKVLIETALEGIFAELQDMHDVSGDISSVREGKRLTDDGLITRNWLRPVLTKKSPTGNCMKKLKTVLRKLTWIDACLWAAPVVTIYLLK